MDPSEERRHEHPPSPIVGLFDHPDFFTRGAIHTLLPRGTRSMHQSHAAKLTVYSALPNSQTPKPRPGSPLSTEARSTNILLSLQSKYNRASNLIATSNATCPGINQSAVSLLHGSLHRRG